jgi:hypothetical protein
LIQEAEQRGAKNASKTFDFIIHRAAYLFVMANWDEIPHLAWWTPERLISEALNRPRNRNFYNHLVGMLSDAYMQLGYGWDTKELYNGQTWKAEIAHSGFKDARRELFPSFFHNQANHTRMGKSLLKGTTTGLQAKRSAAEVRPLLHRQRGVAEHRERIDTAHRDGDAGKILLLRVAERLGKERFDFWFHEDAEVVIDVANRKVAFSVRGSPYMVNQIKKNCGADIGAAISEFHPGLPGYFYPSRASPPFDVPPPVEWRFRQSVVCSRYQSAVWKKEYTLRPSAVYGQPSQPPSGFPSVP